MSDDHREDASQWMRLPPRGKLCPETGLSRSTLAAFVLEAGIPTAVLKRPGKSRGVRIIDRAALKAVVAASTTTTAATA